MREFKTEHDGSHQGEKTQRHGPTHSNLKPPQISTILDHCFSVASLSLMALDMIHPGGFAHLTYFFRGLKALYTRTCSVLHLQRFDSHTDEEDAYQPRAVNIWISAVRSMFRHTVENKQTEWKMYTSASLQEREYTEVVILVWWGGRRGWVVPPSPPPPPPVPVPQSIGKHLLRLGPSRWTKNKNKERISPLRRDLTFQRINNSCLIWSFLLKPMNQHCCFPSISCFSWGLKVASSLSKPNKTTWSLQKDWKYAMTYKKSCSVCVLYLIRWWKEFLFDQGCCFFFSKQKPQKKQKKKT